MPIPVQAEVQEVLSDFESRIRSVLDLAWQDWLEMPKRSVMSPRSRASVVFDFVKKYALSEFDGDPNIKAIPKGQTIRFLFLNQVLIRFKKANAKGIGSNIETQAVIEFIDPLLTIPDLLPKIYKVEICYHLDKLATQVARVAVTARDRDRLLWSYDLERSAPSVLILPTFPNDPTPPPVRPRKPLEKPETGE